MNFRKLQEISRPHFYCLTLDKFFPKLLRGVLRKAAAFGAIISFVLSFDSLPLYFSVADGMFFLFVFVYLSLSFLEFFYRSMRGENFDFTLSSLLFITDEIDASRALLESKLGIEIFLRSGIRQDQVKNFVHSSRAPLIASSLNFDSENVDLYHYVNTLYDTDKSLQSFLSQNSINKEEFLGAVSWVMNIKERKLREDRFWSRENLGAIPSIGTSWAYGVSVDLGKYGVPFERSVNISVLDIENGYRDREVVALEGVLERREEANAIIIDDDDKVCRDVVGRLLKKIKLGVSSPNLEHKNIIELTWTNLLATYKTKGELESELLTILNQAVYAGNVILYISDLSGFATSAKNIGVNLASLLSPYLASRSLQVVAGATNTDFHFFIESSPTLLERFERIIPDKAGVESSINPLLEQATLLERQYGAIFSYPSILTLANGADRAVTYGEMPGKALDLLSEIAPYAKARNIDLLTENDINIFISEKTGVAQGPLKEKEAEKIEHLEELLHKRVIGQNEAVEGIASAIRRSRSGVGNPKRPLSSFLFLGPTGVGKTEVSKSLAESFFGDENKMLRFDMSEYSGPDALSRLIGDFTSNKNGLLANRLRDNPYSVLLLDEFEKAAGDVLDLFLQILDEGVFTDALGKQVGCRNYIIIATSNAGSSLIWETVKLGKNLEGEKDNILDQIIKEKIFRPELLNRFDGVILFHPLQNTELTSIARLGLEKLVKRLKEQSIELVINDDIVNFLVEKGSDPQFGGRSINRAIQNKIEDLVARKIVSGEVGPGGRIEILGSELK